MTSGAGWAGELTIRPGIIAYSGRIGAADLHAHAAVQVYRCHTGELEVTDEAGSVVVATTVVIPARARHSVRASTGTAGSTVFIDPSGSWAPKTGNWVSSVSAWVDDERSSYAKTSLGDILADLTAPAGSLGTEIEGWVRARLPERVIVADLARALTVSEASLRRIARAELGLNVQAYTRWIRLIVALEQVAAGRSITDAAAEAGFADGSHATRACREMFGLSPSEALAHLSVNQI